MKFNDTQKAKLKEYDEAVAEEHEAIARVSAIAEELIQDLGVSVIDLLEAR